MIKDWKDIEEFNGAYQISSHGEVRSADRSVLRKSKNGKEHILKIHGTKLKLRLAGGKKKNGRYHQVMLSKNGAPYYRYVHRLVAQAFIPTVDGKKIINHKNGVKTDNRVENLEWSTMSENMQHAYDSGFMPTKIGPNSKFDECDVLDMRSMYRNGIKIKDIAIRYDSRYATIWRIVKNKRWINTNWR